MAAGGLLQRRVETGHLGRGEEVLTMAAADRDHCCVLGDGGVDHPGHGRGEVRRAGHGIGWDEDHVEGGTGRYRVHDLGVLDLFGARHVGRAGPGEGGGDLEFRRGQAELVVECGQVLADVGEVRPRLVGEFGHHHGLAAAGDPAAQQRRHAVGHLVLAGAVALDEIVRRPARHRMISRGRIGAAGRSGPCRAGGRSRRRPRGQARYGGRRGGQARRQRQPARPVPGPRYGVRHQTDDRFYWHDLTFLRKCWCN